MVTKSAAKKQARAPSVPRHVAEALDRSADDLRHDRTEDFDQYRKRMQARIDSYFAKRKKGGNQ
jgi:hypothetical protein